MVGTSTIESVDKLLTEVKENSNKLKNEGIDLSVHDMRAARDREIVIALERIKSSPGMDKEKYAERVLQDAKSLVEANKGDLEEIKRLRGNSPEEAIKNSDKIKELFDKNKDLIKARAYLIIGAGLTKSKPDKQEFSLFNDLVDSDASTNALIEDVNQACKRESSTLEELHTECCKVAISEIERIHSFLENRVSKPKPTYNLKIDLPSIPFTSSILPSKVVERAPKPDLSQFRPVGQESSGVLGVRVSGNAKGGVVVTDVDPGSPAEKAGIKKGDFIVSAESQSKRWNRTKLDDLAKTVAVCAESFEEFIKGCSSEEVKFELRRDGARSSIKIPVTLTERSNSLGYGAEFDQWTFGFQSKNGVAITYIHDNSPAAASGLKVGDVITWIEVNNKRINVDDVDSFKIIYRNSVGKKLVLHGWRGGEEGEEISLELKPAQYGFTDIKKMPEYRTARDVEFGIKHV